MNRTWAANRDGFSKAASSEDFELDCAGSDDEDDVDVDDDDDGATNCSQVYSLCFLMLMVLLSQLQMKTTAADLSAPAPTRRRNATPWTGGYRPADHSMTTLPGICCR